jgi:hypothetical protein
VLELSLIIIQYYLDFAEHSCTTFGFNFSVALIISYLQTQFATKRHNTNLSTE